MADVETIALALDILKTAGLTDTQLKINSIGCRKCRQMYRTAVINFIGERVDKLCGDCKRRYEKNIFRVLDCKVPACREIIAQVPAVEDFLDNDCRVHFENVKALLHQLGIEFVVDRFLVRGLDYYTRTVYEIAHGALGARDAVGGGGRYDNLVEDLGGPPTGAVGFSLGSVPVILAMQKNGLTATGDKGPDAFVVTIAAGDAGERIVAEYSLPLLQSLRSAGFSAEMDLQVENRTVLG